MFEKLQITRMAQALAAHAGTRMGVIAQNVAHADTPGYKAQDIGDFARVWSAGGEAMRATRPGHLSDTPQQAAARPFASGGGGGPHGESLSPGKGMVEMAAARGEQEKGLAIYRSTSEVIRASLGRR